MGKRLCVKGISLLLCIALAGCANDQQTTKTQGAVIGAVGGAILLGGLGAALGAVSGNSSNITRFAIAGAAAGAALGGMEGYKWGERVAYKKSQYATSEERLKLNIQHASNARQAAEKENKSLQDDIAELRQQIQKLSADAAAGQRDSDVRQKLAGIVRQRRHDATEKVTECNQEIEDRQQALDDERAGGNPDQIAALKSQISQLIEQRNQMEQANSELASISPRIGV